MAVVAALSLTSITLAVVLAFLRHRAYGRRVFYDPRQSWVLGMVGPTIETVSVHCGERGFVLPERVIGAVSGFLELEVRASLSGKLFDPAVEIIAGEFRDIQHLERGVQGARFLNISRLLNSETREERVRLSGQGVKCSTGKVHLHICREKITAEDRVLVVAPHPDDAEIAAFGLYADNQSTVVTLTAGDASDRYQNHVQSWMSLPRNTVANMRILTSLTIPRLGRVPPEKAINLCLPDDRLREMYLHPDRDFQGEGVDALEFSALRQLNCSPLIQDDVACTWKALVHDLSRIIAATKPTIVVLPHPGLDPHPDHVFGAVALAEALQSADLPSGRMFLYTVHNRRSELWPFGPAGSGVMLLPILPKDGLCASGFYSHALSIERQRQKFVALEAMHDVREMQWPIVSPYQQAGRRVAAELRALAHGMGVVPTSYLRRAVRPDELFFVTSFEAGVALARQAIKHPELSRVTA
jgi:LmbE family N-acetylglucosaminyl deacetylase